MTVAPLDPAGLIVKVRTPEAPPPGEGVKTLTEALPAEAISLADICACSCVLETKLVCRALPFHSIVEDETKPEPKTERGKAAPPAEAEDGFKELRTGEGLDTEKLRAFDVSLGDPLDTVTEVDPAALISVGAICALT